MADTERLMNKAQGDDIISALGTIAANILQVPSEKLIIDWSYTTLPTSGNDHTIYAIPTGDADDPWDFYVWNDVDEEWVQFDWNFAVDSTLSTTSENPVQNKVVTAALDTKVDNVTGKGLSTNDYTNEEKTLVATITNKADADDVAGTQTISGNPLTLTDAAPINAESLVVELEPIQDLHGQSAPYVGGAGKNKADIHFRISDSYCDSSVSLSAGQYIASLFDQNFTHDGMVAGVNFSCFLMDGNGQNIKAHVQNGTTLTAEEASQITTLRYYFDRGQYSGTSTEFYGQLEVGSTVTDFAPYSNICPITGYTECEVDDVGKNLFDNSTFEKGIIIDGTVGYAEGTTSFTVENGGVSFTTNTNWRGVYSGLIPVLPNTNYFWSWTESDIVGSYVDYFDKNGDWISNAYYQQTTYFTTPSNAAYIRLSYQNPTAGSISISNIMLASSTTRADFVPYSSTSATIQFGQTVYGGEVDFKTGVVTITDANIASYAGETLPSTWISDRDVYAAGTTPTTGAQVCYKLAEPTTIQLTPQELQLLKGTNNITTNGTTITLGYQPDNVIGEVKGEIQAITEMDYLKILDNNVETPINNYRIYYHLISGAYTLVNMGEMLQHRFIFVEVIKNPSGGVNKKVLHSALIDPRTIDGFEYEMKASGNDTIWIESILDENKFNLSLRTTGVSYTDGDPTDYYVTIRMVD